MTPESLRETCYHEAGHSVISWISRGVVGAIEIHDNGSGLAHVGVYWAGDPALLGRSAMISLAGSAAQAKATGVDFDQVWSNGGRGDAVQLDQIITAISPRADAKDQLWDPLRRGAIEMVERHWPLIERLANEMVRRGPGLTTGAEVLAILSQAR